MMNTIYKSKEMIGKYELPLTGRELLTALHNGKPVQIGRPYLSKALWLIEKCAESVIDVQTEADKAFLTPERFRLNEIGMQSIATAPTRATDTQQSKP